MNFSYQDFTLNYEFQNISTYKLMVQIYKIISLHLQANSGE